MKSEKMMIAGLAIALVSVPLYRMPLYLLKIGPKNRSNGKVNRGIKRK
ncbi:hypothetical protein [Bacillus sp. B15-48]|nr:hypothetical protein [Bacillus sp. B15-48]MBM4765007.1 hypothetical protein [Bacillus sp. B15-48]